MGATDISASVSTGAEVAGLTDAGGGGNEEDQDR